MIKVIRDKSHCIVDDMYPKKKLRTDSYSIIWNSFFSDIFGLNKFFKDWAWIFRRESVMLSGCSIYQLIFVFMIFGLLNLWPASGHSYTLINNTIFMFVIRLFQIEFLLYILVCRLYHWLEVLKFLASFVTNCANQWKAEIVWYYNSIRTYIDFIAESSASPEIKKYRITRNQQQTKQKEFFFYMCAKIVYSIWNKEIVNTFRQSTKKKNLSIFYIPILAPRIKYST